VPRSSGCRGNRGVRNRRWCRIRCLPRRLRFRPPTARTRWRLLPSPRRTRSTRPGRRRASRRSAGAAARPGGRRCNQCSARRPACSRLSCPGRPETRLPPGWSAGWRKRPAVRRAVSSCPGGRRRAAVAIRSRKSPERSSTREPGRTRRGSRQAPATTPRWEPMRHGIRAARSGPAGHSGAGSG